MRNYLLSAVFALFFISCNDNLTIEHVSSGSNPSNYLAASPPMGWNSWNVFGKDLHENTIKETVDSIVSTGLKDVGFEYVVLDDFWHGGRDTLTGKLYPDPERFPSGMKHLADYIHDKGLKFGIYSDAGTKTCGGMPGSYGYEEQDAQTFAEWGVDFLKYDYCYCPDFVSANNDYQMAIRRYKAMGDALNATGHPIMFSICEWGPRSPWLWGKEVGGHMWRVSYDVADIWDIPNNEQSPIGILTSIDAMANLSRFSGPGGWNDPDMLVIGLNNTGYIKGGGCSEIEYRTQMNMWCILSAPLMIGCDVRNMDESTKNILLNKDIIGIDQDPLGKQALRIYRSAGLEVWKKPLTGDRVAIAILNRNEETKSFLTTWENLGLERQTYDVYDVWDHLTKPALPNLSVNLEPHESNVFILTE